MRQSYKKILSEGKLYFHFTKKCLVSRYLEKKYCKYYVELWTNFMTLQYSRCFQKKILQNRIGVKFWFWR